MHTYLKNFLNTSDTMYTSKPCKQTCLLLWKKEYAMCASKPCKLPMSVVCILVLTHTCTLVDSCTHSNPKIKPLHPWTHPQSNTHLQNQNSPPLNYPQSHTQQTQLRLYDSPSARNWCYSKNHHCVQLGHSLAMFPQRSLLAGWTRWGAVTHSGVTRWRSGDRSIWHSRHQGAVCRQTMVKTEFHCHRPVGELKKGKSFIPSTTKALTQSRHTRSTHPAQTDKHIHIRTTCLAQTDQHKHTRTTHPATLSWSACEPQSKVRSKLSDTPLTSASVMAAGDKGLKSLEFPLCLSTLSRGVAEKSLRNVIHPFLRVFVSTVWSDSPPATVFDFLRSNHTVFVTTVVS